MFYRSARRAAIAVIGATIILFGVLLLFIPGPGTLFLLAGVGVLATEFVWAARLLKRVKKQAKNMGDSVGRYWSGAGDATDASEKAPDSNENESRKSPE